MRSNRWNVAVALLLVTLLLGFARSASASDDTKAAALARQYLSLTHQLVTATGIATAVGAQIIRSRPEIKLDVQDAVEAVAPKYEKEVADMNDQVIAIYTQHFTAEELQAMVDFYQNFYKTPAGQKLQQNYAEITDQVADISRLRGTLIGGEVYRALVDKLSAEGKQ